MLKYEYSPSISNRTNTIWLNPASKKILQRTDIAQLKNISSGMGNTLLHDAINYHKELRNHPLSGTIKNFDGETPLSFVIDSKYD